MKTMSQQTCIDQFFKVVSSKRTSGSVAKIKHSKSRNSKERADLLKHVKSSLAAEYTIPYEQINNTSTNHIEIVGQEALDNNKTCLEISNKDLRDPLNINQISQSNQKIEIQKAQTEKLKVNNSLSPVKSFNNTIHLKVKLNKELRTPEKNHSVTDSNSPRTKISPKKLNYSPKLPSGKSTKTVHKPLFGRTIDKTIMIQTVEHMNLAKQGAISPNNFNLEEIYSKGIFNYQYNCINTKTSVKYELSEIVLPSDLYAKILFTIIFTVLSNPINCGYFDENEFDFIYSIITLPTDAQTLLARMIKRKKAWFRKSNINYPDIASDLKDIFTILVSRCICTFDIENENFTTILELLQVDEIYQLCQIMKVNPIKNKKSNMAKLLKLSNSKPLFPGMKSPSTVLYSLVINVLDYCVRITNKTWNIIDKVITLLIPNQDPQTTIADTFFTLCDIYLGKVMFPNIPENRFPVFACNLHLMSYITAKATLSETLQLIEKKNWTEVQNYGKLAMNTLSNLLKTESSRLKSSFIPTHVKRYMPLYVWLKILSVSIDAFKKNEDKTQVVEVLHFLLENNYYTHTKTGKWYSELALIEMYYYKNLEASASVIIKALQTENLTRVDKVDLIERANRILKRKTGLNTLTKITINKILHEHIHQMPKYEVSSNIINAALMPENAARNKTVWCIENNAEGQSYGSVERVAFSHYQAQGFPNGLHCEGALPIILFFTLFWEELYDIHIPGTFVSPYQCAPDDLYTENFYENRRDKIDMKFQIVSDLNPLALSTLMEKKFQACIQYQSIMPSNLLKDSIQLKEIVYCLGVQGVVGICRRLIEDFKVWKAGFPDLIMWNFHTKEHKIVEVKGPRDSLSTKQKLWLEYLNQLGLTTEVCLVQANCSKRRHRRKKNECDDYE